MQGRLQHLSPKPMTPRERRYHIITSGKYEVRTWDGDLSKVPIYDHPELWARGHEFALSRKKIINRTQNRIFLKQKK